MSDSVTVSIGRDKYTSEILSGSHRILADEPRSVGGADQGPSPYDLLLAALGACTVMTLRMYADRKQWPLEGVSVDLRQERIHARDCEDCESKDGMVTRITREITLKGDLDSAQRERLMEIADKCPVHRTLSAEIHIVTQAR